jgi:hypothetical protein
MSPENLALNLGFSSAENKAKVDFLPRYAVQRPTVMNGLQT